MNLIKKSVFTLTFLLFIAFVFAFSSFAAENGVRKKLFEPQGGLMSVSYRGSGTGERENSAAAVAAAVMDGADMVSVSVQKSDEGFVLSATGDSFEEAVAAVRGNALLIVDGAWNFKDELVSFAREKEFLSSIVLRTEESEKKVAQWCAENSDVAVIGVYRGNIVFNAISHLNTAKKAGQPLVQYQSKNYFNVMYDSFTASRYSAESGGSYNPRALSPTYDETLCGKRGDNVVGWDELFDRGFSVIETRNIKGLVAYIDETREAQKELETLVASADSADTSFLSSVGKKNLSKALFAARDVLKDKNSPLSAFQSAESSLLASLNAADNGDENKSEKGALNITAAKVFAVAFFGALIVAAQVFVYKKKEKTA